MREEIGFFKEKQLKVKTISMPKMRKRVV